MKYVLECQRNTGHKNMGYPRSLPKKCGMFFETPLCVAFKEDCRILPEGNIRRQDTTHVSICIQQNAPEVRSEALYLIGTEIAAVATQEQCFVMARQEERPLQFQKFLVYPSCPGMSVFRLIHRMRKMEDHHCTVFGKELPNLCNRRDIRGTGCIMAVIPAAEHALRSHPLGDDHLSGLHPLKIRVAVFMKQCLQLLSVLHGIQPLSPFFRGITPFYPPYVRINLLPGSGSIRRTALCVLDRTTLEHAVAFHFSHALVLLIEDIPV